MMPEYVGSGAVLGETGESPPIKKTEKLTLKPFDIKKGGLGKLAMKPAIGGGASGSTSMAKPYADQNPMGSDDIDESMGNSQSYGGYLQ